MSTSHLKVTVMLVFYKSGVHLSRPYPLMFFSKLYLGSIIQATVDQPIGSSGLYSFALVFLTQWNTTGNLLTSANSIYRDIFLLESIPAWARVDKCGQSTTTPVMYVTAPDTARSKHGCYFSIREVTALGRCFQITLWYDTDEAGAIDLRAAMEIDPAPQGRWKKMNEDKRWWTISHLLHVLLEL